MTKTFVMKTNAKHTFHWAELRAYTPDDGTTHITVSECDFPPSSCTIILDRDNLSRLVESLQHALDNLLPWKWGCARECSGWKDRPVMGYTTEKTFQHCPYCHAPMAEV